MSKPRIIIADRDINYVMALQLKFVEDYFDKVDLEIITEKSYFDEFFMTPQLADILIVSEELYDNSLQRHNISHVFLMTEQYDSEQTAELHINRIFKYTSIKEVFNEIIGNSANVLKNDNSAERTPQIVLVYSASGGTGKTTLAMGMCASLTKNYKRVLYINASRLQGFQHMLDNKTAITSAGIYAKLSAPGGEIYHELKHLIRRELFCYIPPFKAALMSLGLNYSVYQKLAEAAKKSGDFDFVVVDCDVVFDEDKASLINIADKVIVVTSQSLASVSATNRLVENINGIDDGKYFFVCNNFLKDKDNALIYPDVSLKFTVSDYIEHLPKYEQMTVEELSNVNSIQRTVFLVM